MIALTRASAAWTTPAAAHHDLDLNALKRHLPAHEFEEMKDGFIGRRGTFETQP
jgi:hypothetical protein